MYVFDYIVEFLREKLESNLQSSCFEVAVLITALTLMTNQGIIKRKTKWKTNFSLVCSRWKAAAVGERGGDADTNQQMLSGERLRPSADIVEFFWTTSG